ncbi:hypothetical protein PsorP6_011329 [Peronosclerospora sorghi]|uniref:Uncharacterized protein n=1 Tax=Peronosclerospora sorghi TaxID=230839 RepID=A0ACC0WL23_9STRA|nr:hypothetical protein PsorP6_011329 [Peronosclerospora sorghi]
MGLPTQHAKKLALHLDFFTRTLSGIKLLMRHLAVHLGGSCGTLFVIILLHCDVTNPKEL